MMNLKFTDTAKIKTKHFIMGAVWTTLALLFLCIWPGGMITTKTVSRSVADDDLKTGALTPDLPVIQEFIPQFEDLESIGFTMDRKGGQITEGTVVFKVFDAAIQPLFEKRIPMQEIEDGGITDVYVGLKVDTSLPYYFRIETEGIGEQAPALSYRSQSGCGPVENKTFYYGSTVMTDASPTGRYEYRMPLGFFQVMTYGAFLILLGSLCSLWLHKSGRNFLEQKYSNSIWIKISLSIVGILGSIGAGYFLIVADVFKTDTLDKWVFGIGLLFATFIWLYLVVYGSEKIFCFLKNLFQKKNIPSGIRIVLFALICVLSMYYFNSGSNHGHAIATRYMLLCLAGIVASLYQWKELIHKGSLLYSGVCILGFVGYGFWQGLEQTALHQFGLNFMVGLCWGILILRLFQNIREKKIRKMAKGYTLLLFLLFLFFILFRNTREWVFTVTIPFSVLYLQNIEDKKWQELLREFCLGVVLSFFMILGFSLLFRPYHRYNYSRYPLAFYSVATCSLYLIVVFICALTRYVVGFWKQKNLKNNIGNTLVLGTVLCYLLMTVSRTAMLAIGLAGAVLFFVLVFTWYAKRKTALLAQVGIMILALLYIFPVAFTATRSIPAIIGHPYIMSGELWEETITTEDKMDSPKYMNMERFLELNFDKILRYFEQAAGESEKSIFYTAASNYKPITLYAKGVTADTWFNESEGTLGNGRLEIYQAYLRNLNWIGHEDMLLEENDMIYYHAHNTFLQSAYDHGILVGIYFLIVGIAGFIRSIYCFYKTKDYNLYSILPIMIIAAFGGASLTEWTFHPSILIGFSLLLVQAPLLGKEKA